MTYVIEVALTCEVVVDSDGVANLTAARELGETVVRDALAESTKNLNVIRTARVNTWAPNRPGEPTHAVPASGKLVDEDTCGVCGHHIFRDGTDDEGTVIYTHDHPINDYFCHPDEED